MTGILIWDLSAAFDTIDIELLVKKLAIYGFSNKTCEWYSSFLTGQTQKVMIGKTLSDSLNLSSGVPQGGVLSPIIFTLFTSDLEYWCKHSKIFSYADDTTSSCQGKDPCETYSLLKSINPNVIH